MWVYCDELVLKKKPNLQRKALQRLSAQLRSRLILLLSALERRKRAGDKSQDQRVAVLKATRGEFRQKSAGLIMKKGCANLLLEIYELKQPEEKMHHLTDRLD